MVGQREDRKVCGGWAHKGRHRTNTHFYLPDNDSNKYSPKGSLLKTSLAFHGVSTQLLDSHPINRDNIEAHLKHHILQQTNKHNGNTNSYLGVQTKEDRRLDEGRLTLKDTSIQIILLLTGHTQYQLQCTQSAAGFNTIQTNKKNQVCDTGTTNTAHYMGFKCCVIIALL